MLDMLSVKNKLQKELKQIIKKLYGLTDSNFEAEIERPKEAEYGDYSSNLAMRAAKKLKKSPREVADEVVKHLESSKKLKNIISEIKVQGPGFINFYISKDCLYNQAKQILKSKKDFDLVKIGKNQKVQIEFISANPTGPLTIGNGRGGFVGDALANVLTKCGYKVTREYLVNDAGNQIKALGHSVLKDSAAVYQGEYIDLLNKKLNLNQDPYKVGEQAADYILENLIKKTVSEKMKINFDVWFSERCQLRETKKIDKIITKLKNKEELYEEEGAWWFKSKKYGDDRDRVLVKSDGSFTYLAQDFAYLENKFNERKFSKVINLWGADHHGDVPGLLNAAKVLGVEGRQEIILFQLLKLIQDGKEVRMSKRQGNYITMDELIETVGHDSARFIFLMYSTDTHMNFDLDLAKDKSDKNPVYYCQYAFARMSGILNNDQLKNYKYNHSISELSHNSELNLLKVILKWPELLSEICTDYQVHKLTQYTMELADKFHQFYANCRVVDNGNIIGSRLSLVKLSKKILKEVLSTIGVSSPEQM